MIFIIFHIKEIFFSIAMTNNVLNPILYALLNPLFIELIAKSLSCFDNSLSTKQASDAKVTTTNIQQ